MRHRDLADHFEVDIEDASSLGRTLAASLALPEEHAQALLEMTDPVARLEGLISLLHDADEDEDG
jgi:Lon protease-like protein